MEKYRVVYADPAWSFKTYSKKGLGRSAQAHYECSSIEDMMAIPVKDWIADDATLFMWITDPFIPRGIELMNAWGFEYSTVAFYWAKLNRKINTNIINIDTDFFLSTGYYTRANPEQMWLGTRKKKQKVKSRSVRKLIVDPVREHSRKPDIAYDRIEALYDGPYLEMFSRSSRPGWDAMGNEVGLFDNGHVETRKFSSDLTRKKYELCI